MKRKDFIHDCGFACLGLLGVSALLESCSTTKAVKGQLTDKRLTIALTEFLVKKSDQTGYKRYIIVRNEAFNYPIVVYRESDTQYTALLLRCSHQQNELNVSGELLTCPAHGSEFNNRGEVRNGPANTALRTFPVTISNNELFIDLRKQA